MIEEEIISDLLEMPGFSELRLAEELHSALIGLKSADASRGRLWAIAATDAEKLFAWIGYVVGVGDEQLEELEPTP